MYRRKKKVTEEGEKQQTKGKEIVFLSESDSASYFLAVILVCVWGGCYPKRFSNMGVFLPRKFTMLLH